MARPVERVRDRASFEALRRSRHRARRGGVGVAWVPPAAAGPPRVAYAIGRRAGGAVVRNRLRRRLRAVVAELAPELPTGTYLVSAGPDVLAQPHEVLRMNVLEAVAAASGTGTPRP